jgi:hypothetical protein
MQTLAVQPWSVALATEVATFPDHLVHCLAAAGVGLVEASLPADGDTVPWRYTPRRAGGPRELARLPVGQFRPVLARLAHLTGSSPYCGHALFAVHSAPNWPAQEVHRFSLFLCNEPTMGIWVRLYLYCIDHLWPMAGVPAADPSAAADRGAQWDQDPVPEDWDTG